MKTDFRTLIPAYRAPRGRFEVVDVPRLQYLMVDGHGDPNTSTSYADALASIYPAAYALKFLSKRELDRDYVVPPLEALWWADDMDAFTSARDKSRWDWTVMILTPDWLSDEHLDAVRDGIRSKGRAPRLDEVRLATLGEGLSVQTLHVGPYDAEAETLERMHHEFMPAEGLRMTGKHHEIYLSDARRTAPEKLRTILRQPVAAIAEES